MWSGRGFFYKTLVGCLSSSVLEPRKTNEILCDQNETPSHFSVLKTHYSTIFACCYFCLVHLVIPLAFDNLCLLLRKIGTKHYHRNMKVEESGHEKQKKKKSKKSAKKDDDVAVDDRDDDAIPAKEEVDKAEKKKKKKHKKNKKRKHEETVQEETPEEEGETVKGEEPKATKQQQQGESEMSSKDKRQKRKEERKLLMELVPLKDEHGISYTKQQLRRMRKRVARGLAPLETEEEKRERLRQDSLLRKQEEAELQGMIYQKDGTTKNEDDSDDDDDEEEEDKGSNDGEDRDDGHGLDEEGHGEQQTTTKHTKTKRNDTKDDNPEKLEPEASPRKKARRNKPVPSDYICQACKNEETPPLHWIYDCPLKKTMPGINHKKSNNHVHDPSNLKVFVSGLPFDVKVKDVRQLFSACGNVKRCKLLTFPDTERCKGQAYLTFETSEAALEALKLNGSSIGGDNEEEPGGGKKRKGLTLKVSKMLSRAVTKKKGGKASYKK